MYTRRQFLQLAGITLVGSQLTPAAAWFKTLADAAPQHQGRTLAAAAIYAQPSLGSPVAHLWPDSITPILSADAHWYRLPQGFVPRAALQPMKPFTFALPPLSPVLPFWAEVAGAAASVRQHCSSSAPLIARIGHGGVLQVIDYLPDASSPWYGVASDDGTLLGWTQAIHWQPVNDVAPDTSLTLELNHHQQQLTTWDSQQQIVLQAPCSIGSSIQAGDYAVAARQVGGGRLRQHDAAEHFGVPWRIRFGTSELAGAYWHNDFGTPLPGSIAQTAPLLAEWLYPRVTRVIVV